jgi:hypothetical protein
VDKWISSGGSNAQCNSARGAKARLFDRIAHTLLAEEGLGDEYIRHSSEWTGNLSFLLGIHDRQQATRS